MDSRCSKKITKEVKFEAMEIPEIEIDVLQKEDREEPDARSK